jgi:hypothetical protein
MEAGTGVRLYAPVLPHGRNLSHRRRERPRRHGQRIGSISRVRQLPLGFRAEIRDTVLVFGCEGAVYGADL